MDKIVYESGLKIIWGKLCCKSFPQDRDRQIYLRSVRTIVLAVALATLDFLLQLFDDIGGRLSIYAGDDGDLTAVAFD